ncbi:ice nucleation protein-like isoform X2 [Hyperolius riggenbachi]|uniref:ice nucleation protein-like isoform X2 n=1 Tax=Hyperolius riggenbachi TaxID=752182 RepID=UPI0035A2A8A4
MAIKKRMVGIFSRESSTLYDWLIFILMATKVVKDIRQVYISNRFHEFQQEVYKCDFAILYHSKKRGRINVTDVTDSLYDEELDYLCTRLGQENVVVVIDDLDDSSDSVKSDILLNQPSIRNKAKELFLFSSDEKTYLTHSPFDAHSGYRSQSTLKKKRDDLKRVIKGESIHSDNLIQGNTGNSQINPCNKKFLFIIIFFAILIILLATILGTTLPHATNTTLPHGTNTTLVTNLDTTLPHGTNTTLSHGTNTTLSHGTNTTLVTILGTTLPHGTKTTLAIILGTTLPHGTNTTLVTILGTTLSNGTNTTLSHG